MHSNTSVVLMIAAFLLQFAPAVTAKVTAQQAVQLDGPKLTPLGAERAGNSDGAIPAWTGGITSPPLGYEPGDRLIDPYANDALLFTINTVNLASHAQHLSEGQQALIQAYPDTWRMNIYPTRRSASYPAWVYQAVINNASSAEVIQEGKGGVVNATISSPFPIPQTGIETVWNHNLRWRGIRVSRSSGQAPVTPRGHYNVILTEQELAFPYAAQQKNVFQKQYPNVMMAVKSKIIQPALLSGNAGLFIEPINQTRDPRKSWLYNRNIRRVLRVFANYDFPAPNSDNLRTIDEFELFNGAPDRFSWTLLGKQQLYIPYNSYRLHSDEYDAEDILSRKHINPDLARYELHRVWVVEGKLKPGRRHIYSRRMFYLDEDSWQIAVADNYDMSENLWRTAEAHAINYYQVPVQWSTMDVYYDLAIGRYLAVGLDNQRNDYHFSEIADPREFSPNALLYYIR